MEEIQKRSAMLAPVITDGGTNGRTNGHPFFFLPFPKTKPLVPSGNDDIFEHLKLQLVPVLNYANIYQSLIFKQTGITAI